MSISIDSGYLTYKYDRENKTIAGILIYNRCKTKTDCSKYILNKINSSRPSLIGHLNVWKTLIGNPEIIVYVTDCAKRQATLLMENGGVRKTSNDTLFKSYCSTRYMWCPSDFDVGMAYPGSYEIIDEEMTNYNGNYVVFIRNLDPSLSIYDEIKVLRILMTIESKVSEPVLFIVTSYYTIQQCFSNPNNACAVSSRFCLS